MLGLYLVSSFSLFAQSVNSDKIENIKIQSFEIPSGFVLRQERLTKPGSSLNEQVNQFWRKGNGKQDLELINEDKHETSFSIGASSYQKWYREYNSGEKDKIEIDIIICPSEKEINNTINYYTKEAFSTSFVVTEIPFVGEKSWMPNDIKQENNYYTVMFLKSNVFIRLFIRFKDKNLNELEQITKKIAKKIEYKITPTLN